LVRVIVGLLGLTAIGAAASWWTASPSLVAAAREAYEKGNWERAAELSRRRLKTASSDPDALQLYARASIRLNRDELGNTIYKDRLGSERMQPEDYFLVGLSTLRAGRSQTAFEIWEKGAMNGPAHPELLDGLARLAIKLERLDAADAAARQLVHQPRWETRGLLFLGEIQYALDDPGGAADALQKTFSREPGAGSATFAPMPYRKLLARSLLQLGRPLEAQKQLETVLAAARVPGVDMRLEANWLLSRAYLQQGQTDKASAALAQAGAYGTENRLMPEPSPYVGAARCSACHSAISQAHRRTRHAQTFHHGTELQELPVPDQPLADPDDPKVTHTINRDGGRIRVETRVGPDVFHTVVQYAFGTVGRYVTMIGRDAEQTYRALRLSHYCSADGPGWDGTSGDAGDRGQPENVHGRPIEVRDGVVRCLFCHVTRPRAFREPNSGRGRGPEAGDSGIGCERCHGPGGNHIAAVNAGFADSAIVNIGTASATTINAQCGQCHIVGSRAEIESAPSDPKFVRSSALTMTFSRCYTESDGAMSCLTCHDGHHDAERATAFYETKCLTCHSARDTARTKTTQKAGYPSADVTPTRTVCPVGPTKECLNCHMPKVQVADLHAARTDHFIRVRSHSAPGGRADSAQR
jgi:tetratricopeptide (TPR) repeat protein